MVAEPTLITDISQLDLTNGVYSYADYLTWQFTEAVELIRGHIFPMAGPNRRHQGISAVLSGHFYNYLLGNPCAYYAAPFDVRLYDQRKSARANRDVYTVVQPDLCIVCDATKLDDAGCLGAPDLVVEILSPGNSAKEMRLKKELYEENAVREYWIIDPDHETAFQFVLTETNAYGPATILVSPEDLTSAVFPTLNVPLAEVFAGN